MEWTIPVNDIFDERVTKITATMLPNNFSGDVRTTRSVQEQIAKLIDLLGEESASSQGLNKVITSADKLRNNPKHTIYLLKDDRGNEGQGEIIGLLKVGRKHLFLFDAKEAVHEVEPLCVLDFYIVRDRQRMGFGRMLFDFMLHELEVTASQMAIDGPSDKMELFLARNFGISKLLRQNNNFAVAPNFFDRSDDEISNGAGDASDAPAAAVGRFAAPKPTSAIANVIHGAGHEEATRRSLSPTPVPAASGAAAVEPRACFSPGGRVYVGFTPMELRHDEEEPEPELTDDAYEFDSDQPAAERRDEMRLHGPLYSPPALERPASLAVQPPAEPADVPAAGMPSGGGPAAHCAAGNISYAQCAAGMPSSSAAVAQCATGSHSATQSAAGTPSGTGGRRDSQLTNKGSQAPAAAAATPGASFVEPRAGRPVERRYGPAVPRPETSPGGRVYVGFTPPHMLIDEEEEPSDPELDDAAYEAYEFDPDQPAAERRDEMRARGPYY